mgnify:CR=1 FL=1|jgi:hypothetical protein
MATKKTATKTRPEQIDAAVAIGAETVEQVIQASETVLRASQDAIGKIDTTKNVQVAREQLETASKTMFAGQDQVTAFTMATFDAYSAAFEAFSKGSERFGTEITDFARKSVEATVENGQNMMACNSVNEAFDLRNRISRETFDSAVAQGAKLTEMSLKTANDGWAPIQDHANKALDILKPHSA